MSLAIRCLLFIVGFPLGISSSLYDPHVFPESGPFVEGWYMRMVDFTARRSFGVVFGSALPQDPQTRDNLAFMGILDGRPGQKLRSYAVFPDVETFHVTVRGGKHVTSDPDVISPPDFEVTIPSVGYISVTGNMTELSVTVEDICIQASIGSPVVWGPDGVGPEGWVQDFGNVFEVNWFVYSLGSPLLHYEVHDLTTDVKFTGRGGYVHMEKNWGKTFPEAWVWSQGISDTDRGITYALSYGLMTVFSLNIRGHLFGYRNPDKGIVVNMTPYNSILTVTKTDGCTGEIGVTLTGWSYKVSLNVTAPIASYSDCLYCPQANGFHPDSIESYIATADILISRRRSLMFFEEIDRQQFKDFAALEFGGSYLCRGSCSGGHV